MASFWGTFNVSVYLIPAGLPISVPIVYPGTAVTVIDRPYHLTLTCMLNPGQKILESIKQGEQEARKWIAFKQECWELATVVSYKGPGQALRHFTGEMFIQMMENDPQLNCLG